MNDLINFYLESNAHKSVNTNEHSGEVLRRILGSFTTDYGVTITSDSITGLTPVILQRWFNAAAQTRKVSTMNNYVCILNPFLRWCYDMEYIPKDYSHTLKTHRIPDPETLPPDQRPKDKYLTHAEATALLHCTGRNHIRDRAIISLFLHTGLRVSELCSLNICDILDHPRGSLVVRRKGGHWKTVEVGPECYTAIETYLQTRPDAQDHSRPLFLTTHGERINRRQVHKFLSHKQRQLGVATGPHALRHTFLSEAEKLGGAAVARDLANQRSLTVTNRYVHSTQAQRQATVRRLCWTTPEEE